MTAHVAGLPLEELLSFGGAGAGLVVARMWLAVRLRRLGGRRGAA